MVVQDVATIAYLSTVPNQAGQSRFRLLCPDVPPNTPIVPTIYSPSQRRFFCPQQQVAHTRRHDTHALSVAMLILAVEILRYAGREVRDSPPRDGPHTHTERKVSVACSAHAHIHLSRFWSEIPELKQMCSLFVFLIG